MVVASIGEWYLIAGMLSLGLIGVNHGRVGDACPPKFTVGDGHITTPPPDTDV